jgi:hypothetical protein
MLIDCAYNMQQALLQPSCREELLSYEATEKG